MNDEIQLASESFGSISTKIAAKTDVPVKMEGLGEMFGSGSPMPVYVTNMGAEGIGGLMEESGLLGETNIKGVSQDLADISQEITDNTNEAAASSGDWLSKIKDGFSSIGDWVSQLFSSLSGIGGGGAGGGGGSWWSGLFSTGASAAVSGYAGGAMAEGGVISEPIVGKGLKSGEVYNFGENTKYGENEIVAPMKKLQKGSSRSSVQYHMPIHLSSIDTQSGVQFLTKHADTIQSQMIKNLRQNKPIRKGIQNTY